MRHVGFKFGSIKHQWLYGVRTIIILPLNFRELRLVMKCKTIYEMCFYPAFRFDLSWHSKDPLSYIKLFWDMGQHFCSESPILIDIDRSVRKRQTLSFSCLERLTLQMSVPYICRTWACFLSLARSKLRLCLANQRASYFSNLAWDWLSIVWTYSKQETENRPRTWPSECL